jgi:hypothetical protein
MNVISKTYEIVKYFIKYLTYEINSIFGFLEYIFWNNVRSLNLKLK